jgi:hypothetical protein
MERSKRSHCENPELVKGDEAISGEAMVLTRTLGTAYWGTPFMFEKIWYPEEMLVACSRVHTMAFIAPFLLLGFVLGFEIVVVFYILFYLLRSVVWVRGAVTLEIDSEEAEVLKAMKTKRKYVVISMMISTVILLLAAGLLFRDGFYPALPVAIATILVLLLGMVGLMPKTITVTSLLAVILAMLGAGLIFSWELALITGMIPLMIFPEGLATSIKTDRVLRDDLAAKFPPSAARNVGQGYNKGQ